MTLICTPINDAPSRSRFDPTGTTAIRIALRAEAARRLNKWKQLVRIALLSHDVFGHSQLRVGQNLPVESTQAPVPRQFGWLQPADKLKSFADWLASAWDSELVDPHWWRGLMRRALRKGLDKAEAETRPTEQNYHHVSALLDEQIKREVVGIGQAAMQAVNRMVGDHVHRKTSPLTTYRDVSKAIDKIAGKRLELMANTYVVKGFNRIKLAVYRNAGLTHVGVIPERLLQPRSLPGRSSLDALFDRRTRKRHKKKEPDYDEEELVNWVTAGDDVCPYCLDLEESSPFELDLAESLYPAHPNSFLPGTRVQGNILAALKAFYAGPAIEIETRSGEWLRVTAKHPVVTALGVLVADDLREGMQLFSHRWNIGRPTLAADNDDHPPLIEQIFETLQADGLVSIAPSAEDLHGDASSVHGDIDIVCADRRLLTYLQAAFAKRKCQFILPEAEMRASVVVSGRGHRALRNRTLSSPNCGPSGAALIDDCLSATLLDGLPFEVLRCGTPADSNAVAPKSSNEDAAFYSGLVRELFERSAGQITLDQLVDFPWLKRIARRAGLPQNVARTKPIENYFVRQAGFLRDLLDSGSADIARDEIVNLRRFNYIGHVYDVQSTVGWILAPEIICLQCRCAVEPYFDYGSNSDLDFD